jgi:hydrogenase maturation protease
VTAEVEPVLVVGYGNELRTDDAAGRWLAERLADLRLPGVEVRSVQQLTPELAADLAGRRRVIFVDAALGTSSVQIRPLAAGPAGSTVSHVFDPGVVLALGRELGHGSVDAFVLTVPAAELGVGMGLSAVTRAAADEALPRLVALCQG